MKAQSVKNAVIVPVGAKGGFVVKRPPPASDRVAVAAAVLDGYRTFIRGLLELTDNRVDGRVVPPEGVVRHDGDDPYLVVAADKGTGSFSDVANELAAEYGYWLGDAFASGGSAGFDHKEMGITSRGAWISVRAHFRALGVDADTAPLRVVGIGDMSGDVFGNGLLRSPHLRLLAAFDHRHVFVDPDPDPAASFAERQRLFELPASSWADYDPMVLSAGGGVYERSAKSVDLTPVARAALGVDDRPLTPDELVGAVLRAPVDLLWNGGIGTFVKASTESDADVGDRTNDPVRIDATELRCRVVAEGGNLGFTQRARVEYALAGGRINTDAIDNSAGVDCSDHEVNIKILLQRAIAAGSARRREARRAPRPHDRRGRRPRARRQRSPGERARDRGGRSRSSWSACTRARWSGSSSRRDSTAPSKACPRSRPCRNAPPPASGSRRRSSRYCSPTPSSSSSARWSRPTCPTIPTSTVRW